MTILANESMKQTPAHSFVNGELLSMIPPDARRIVEVGCMHGALAKAYREKNPGVHYVGIDIDADYAEVAAGFCDKAIAANIETMDDAAYSELFPSDCWIFGDCLEHLRDPWRVLKRLRESANPGTTLLVCIPNVQHWTIQWRLASGNFRYEEDGLMDRTHLRWFTRQTALEMFEASGWHFEGGLIRVLDSPKQKGILEAIKGFARSMSLDPEVAARDATAYQYVFRLSPAAA